MTDVQNIIKLSLCFCFLTNKYFNQLNLNCFATTDHVFEIHHFILSRECAWAENLARAGVGMWGEALNFLVFFVSFLCQDKNESPSGRTKLF